MISKVREIAKEIVGKSDYVKIDTNNIYSLSKKIKDSPLSEWEPQLPVWYTRNDIKDPSFTRQWKMQFINYELIANSVNYCYWYGRGDIRPQGSSSCKMYQLLDESYNFDVYYYDSIDVFYQKLVENRFPLIEDRCRHIKEVIDIDTYPSDSFKALCDIILDQCNVNEIISCLTQNYPGYASDMFLKRAQLFIMQVQRGLNIFSEGEIKKLTVPADYQLPKMLRYFDCIHYSDDLQNDIERSKLIPKGSIQEIEIRAATIVACDMLAEISGTNTMVVDNFLWQSRKECNDPFHLTITTDY